MSQPRLYPVACESKDFALTGYADTIICEPGIGNEASTLIGIRLGGEPAATQALATVLRTGAPFRITVDLPARGISTNIRSSMVQPHLILKRC